MHSLGYLVFPLSYLLCVHAVFNPLRQYSGNTFFQGWDFYDNVDNTTWGNVTYLGQQSSSSQGLAYVDQNTGRAFIKVDNKTNLPGPSDQVPFVHRNSVRITTKDTYGIGSLIIMDIVHLPYGCSVWPSFWTLGTGVAEWPQGGEIDIIESINLMNSNQMALHTTGGCVQQLPQGQTVQTGTTGEGDCSKDRGCIVTEGKSNSAGAGFAQAGGGVWAVQLDVSGFYIWFWSRPDIPNSIKSADADSKIDLADWGTPSAAYPVAGCDLKKYFTPQQLILDITLCGAWAGIQDLYTSTCHTETNNCVYDNIIGVGSPTYDTAYFEINYLRTYEVANGTVSGSSTITGGTPVSTFVVPNSSTGTASASTTDPFANAASRADAALWTLTAVSIMTLMLL